MAYRRIWSGNARVSTNQHDLSSQLAGLKELTAPENLVYVDYGITSKNRERPGFQQALVDPAGKLLSNVLAMVAEFESDLIRAGTREGMQIAKAKGKLHGKQPKLSRAPEIHRVAFHHGGQHTAAKIVELFGVARSTVYRIVQRSA